MKEKLRQLRAFLRPLTEQGAALAFSGGVDSTLLLAVLSEMRKEKPFPLLLLTAVSTLQPPCDLEAVKKISEKYGLAVDFLHCDVLALEQVRINDPLRCYYCKKLLFETMLSYAGSKGITTLLEGSHGDDLKTYRPGKKALEELGVVSPLALLGITKKEIRAMAEMLNVECSNKPSSPCLATRFDYGTVLTEADLARVGAGEAVLRTLLGEKADLRLRVHGNLARIEVTPAFFSLILDKHAEIAEKLKQLGFEKVTLDLAGFASGSYDGKLKEVKNVGTGKIESFH